MNNANTNISTELDTDQLNALEAVNDHLVEVPAMTPPAKLKAKRTYLKGIWSLPFTATNPDKSDTPFWTVPAAGGILGGFEVGRAMAGSYLKLLRDSDLQGGTLCSCLGLISESLNTRIEKEYRNDLKPHEQSYEYDSLDGQMAGFFNTLDDWLVSAAKQFNSNLDDNTNNDFIKLANIGLKKNFSGKN